MAFTDDQNIELSAKLNASRIKKNPKGFDYLEGWFVIAEANRIFGFDGWSREIVKLNCLHEPFQNEKQNWGVSYGCTVRITVTAGEVTVTRDGCGFGSGFSKDIGSAHESAIKEAETDAMKRALMTFGNQFGLALYDKDKENVEAAPQVDEREAWVNRQIAWIETSDSLLEIQNFWTENNRLILGLEPYQLAPLERAKEAAKHRLTAIQGPKERKAA